MVATTVLMIVGAVVSGGYGMAMAFAFHGIF
jgi:hypothetical protein